MRILIFVCALLCCSVRAAFAEQKRGDEADTAKLRTLIVMFDGLRTDYITPQLMPRLYVFKNKAAYGNDHHSVFPTVTRVNAASYATGSYPVTHGLMENSLFIPKVDAAKPQNTGNAQQLMKVDSVMNGKLLTAISLGEILQQSGEKLFVYSSGSTGQAFLQNHKVNGVVINPDMILPASFKEEVISALGTPPPDATPNTERHRWVANALCLYTLNNNGPLVSAIWFSDPDGTTHEHGIGVPVANESLRSVDRQFGRILDSIHAKGLDEVFNILVSTDHGFISYRDGINMTDFLVRSGLKESNASSDVVIAGSGIYVKDHNEQRIRNIVTTLQQQQWVGGLFTKAGRPGSNDGFVEGTLSLEMVYANHPERMPDIIVSENWDDRKNEYGYPGTAASTGVAGHGGSSKYEIHIPFIASGPSFKKSYTSNIPSSNIDMVPTILHLHHITIPPSMQGRILTELMNDDKTKAGMAVKPKQVSATAKHTWGSYTVTIETVEWKNHRYINFISASRAVQQPVK